MNKRRVNKLILYVALLQFITILFALLIEKAIDLIVEVFNICLKMEVILLFAILFIGLILFWIVYRQIYSLLLFEPIATSILSNHQKQDFLRLLKRVKNKESLTKYQKSKLQYFVNKSPLPADFVAKQTSDSFLSPWHKIVIVVLIVYISFILKRNKNDNE